MPGRVLMILALVMCAASCAMFHGRTQCLDGPVPHVNRPDEDEMFALMRREWTRSKKAPSPYLRAHILEGIPGLFPDVSDRTDEPNCKSEFVSAVGDLDHRPVRFDRMLIARIRAAGKVEDTTDVMAAKARFLIAVARLDDGQLTDYQPLANEPGPLPPRALVRELAIALLGKSNLYMNDPAAHSFIDDQITHNNDATTQNLLRPAIAAENLFSQRPAIVDKHDATTLRRWLAGAPDPTTLELVLARITNLGRDHARTSADLGTLLEDIIAAHGTFALTRGVPGADRDLWRAALAARFQLVVDTKGGALPPLAPLRQPFDPRANLMAEPAAGTPTPADAAQRLADLDGELQHLRSHAARCVVYAELPQWIAREQSDARFLALVAPQKDDADRGCRRRAAFALHGVTMAAFRAALSPTLTATDLAPIQPAWLDASSDLRAIVGTLATQARGSLADDGKALASIEPLFDHLLELDADSTQPADRAEGIAIANTWITALATVEAHGPSYYGSEIAAARLLVLSDVAERLGVTDAARTLFATIAASPSPGPAARYTHLALVRAATIAAGMLAPAATAVATRNGLPSGSSEHVSASR